ncbi:hypothetical protein L4D76_27830 [Photobacterium sagamiensis]|uniref:hypothetical protein n=1 Tax=Photobacterium sagamiensis TaxID=2910241 RepID=UPI003D0BEEBF
MNVNVIYGRNIKTEKIRILYEYVVTLRNMLALTGSLLLGVLTGHSQNRHGIKYEVQHEKTHNKKQLSKALYLLG